MTTQSATLVRFWLRLPPPELTGSKYAFPIKQLDIADTNPSFLTNQFPCLFAGYNQISFRIRAFPRTQRTVLIDTLAAIVTKTSFIIHCIQMTLLKRVSEGKPNNEIWTCLGKKLYEKYSINLSNHRCVYSFSPKRHTWEITVSPHYDLMIAHLHI